MKKRHLITILAAAAIIVGGVYGVEQLYAGCGGCGGHAKAEKTEATKASADTDAKASTVDATKSSCSRHGAVNAQKASATCSYTAGAKACATDGKGATTAKLMTADAALAKLAHCGINPNTVDAEKLSSMLADKGCCGYSAEQWATMLKSIDAMDAKEAKAVYANATKEEPCASEKCPMTLVAKELAEDTKNN